MKTSIQDVKSFWEANPVCAARIPYPLGTKEYFEYYDRLREHDQSIEFQNKLHEYKAFARKRVLDVGSGNGYVLSKYALEGADVYGVDITQVSINLCKKRFELLGLKSNFFVGNAEELPLDNEYFDCVCSMGVLHHVPNPPKAIEEIYRVLKPGGRVILMFYHRNSLAYRFAFPVLSLTSGKSIQQLVNEVDGAGNPKGDVYSRVELQGLLRGFANLEFFTGRMERDMVLPRGSRIFGFLIRDILLRMLEKRWGWHLFVKGFKG